MKKLSTLTLGLSAACALALLTQCSSTGEFSNSPSDTVNTDPRLTPVPERVVSERTFDLGNKRFIERRVVLSESPYETENRVVQVR